MDMCTSPLGTLSLSLSLSLVPPSRLIKLRAPEWPNEGPRCRGTTSGNGVDSLLGVSSICGVCTSGKEFCLAKVGRTGSGVLLLVAVRIDKLLLLLGTEMGLVSASVFVGEASEVGGGVSFTCSTVASPIAPIESANGAASGIAETVLFRGVALLGVELNVLGIGSITIPLSSIPHLAYSKYCFNSNKCSRRNLFKNASSSPVCHPPPVDA
mmetsp:Transcript_27002/g.25857  ORF Transcript_27002/g.25857 Transcript_27002/m.25857 type:complete len:211 (+) Transcript_27002:710-1342(+)